MPTKEERKAWQIAVCAGQDLNDELIILMSALQKVAADLPAECSSRILAAMALSSAMRCASLAQVLVDAGQARGLQGTPQTAIALMLQPE